METNLCGLVLAGGRSTRMGSDKASLTHPDGRSLARRTCDLLRASGCKTVVLSLRHGQEIPEGFSGFQDLSVVRDPEGNSAGPLTGMVAAMRQEPDACWLVLACDLPSLDAITLSTLIESRREGENFLAYRSATGDLPEPLCACYYGALPLLEEALTGDLRSPREVLIRQGCRLLDPVSPTALVSANTPDEWAAASVPEWNAELVEIWLSAGHDFRGRHQKERCHHETRAVAEVECVAGMGLRGDRYFGYKENFKGQITFIDAAAVQGVRDEFGLPELSSSVFRRNLVVRGVDLGAWLGKRFRFQGIDFEGAEECKPCYWMDKVAAPGAEEFLKANFRGGLRARILTGGVLRTSGNLP